MLRVITFALTLIASGAASAAAPVLDQAEALRISQAALGNRLDDHAFRDTRNQPVQLSDLRGKPLILSLVYTGCTSVCPLVLQNLYAAVESAQEALGVDSFTVATIGFDTRHDTPERMRAFASTQGVDLPNWQFLSADAATIERLASQVGFVMFPSAQGFDHMAQTTIIDEGGVIYRQVYGGDFATPAIVEPLKALVFGRRTSWTSVDGLINRVRLFCTLYDPRSGRYRFDYSVVIGTLIGLLCLTTVAVLVIREWRRTGRMRPGA